MDKINLEKQGNNVNSLEKIIEEINDNIYNGELTEIFEVTYVYEGGFNKTLFVDFLDDNFGNIEEIKLENKQKILKEIYNKVQKKLKNKEKLFFDFIDKVKNVEAKNRESEIKKDLLLGALEYGLKIIKITELGLIFEIEKAGLDLELNQEEKQKRILEIQRLEKEIFGGEIKDNPKEVILVYEFLKDNFEKNNFKLNSKEKDKYLFFLEKIKKYLPKKYKYVKKESKNISLDENEFLNKKISRDSYVKILQKVFELLDLDIKVRVENRASIYDGEYHLGIPNSKKYDFLTIKRILELISHEIEAHTINLKNNKELIGYFRSAANLEKEEGLAIVMENLLNGKKLDDIGIPQHFPKVFMGEILTGKELKEFLRLDNKISPDTGYEGRFFRLKRNYDLNLPGVQHKDTSYGRGALKVVKLLKDIQGKKIDLDIRDLFLGKVGFKDLKKAKELMQIKKMTYNDLHMPLFSGELVKYLFEIEDNNYKSRRRKEPNQKDFLKYLKNKYPFIDFDNIEIKTISFLQKMKIGRILGEIKKVF